MRALWQLGILLALVGLSAFVLFARCARARPAIVDSVDLQGIVRLKDGRTFKTSRLWEGTFTPGMTVHVSPPHEGFERTDDWTLTPQSGRFSGEHVKGELYPMKSPSSGVSPSGSTLQARPPSRAVTTRWSRPST